MDDQAADGANDTRAAPEPARADPIAGDLVSASFDYDGGRQVTVYVPADGPEAVVFAGDGQLISHWGGYLEAADLPPTMIVGAYGTDEEDEMVRIHEYSPPFDAVRFAAHESFFVEDVRRWVRSRFDVALPAERTAVCGVSASGELSLAMGLRHPDLYGAVFSASPGGGYRPPAVMPTPLPARLPRRRHTRAVLPRERDPVGERAARGRRRRRHDGAGRQSRRPILGSRVPTDGRVGVWTLKDRGRRSSTPGREPVSRPACGRRI